MVLAGEGGSGGDLAVPDARNLDLIGRLGFSLQGFVLNVWFFKIWISCYGFQARRLVFRKCQGARFWGFGSRIVGRVWRRGVGRVER